MNDTIKISDRELKVLAVLAENFSEDYGGPRCIYMRSIALDTGLTVVQVKRSVRSLARKGLAEYVRGLMDDDGFVAGSGYCATESGFRFWERENSVG